MSKAEADVDETTLDLTVEECENYTVGGGHPLIGRRIQDRTKGSEHVVGKIVTVKDGRCALEWSSKETLNLPRALTFAEVLPLLVEESGVQDVESSQKTDKLYCQDELNKKFMGPDFHLHLRYAQQMVSVGRRSVGDGTLLTGADSPLERLEAGCRGRHITDRHFRLTR